MEDAKRGGPNPIDIAVGERVRARRRELGLSQSQLAQTLGITFQQVQKYERGANRVSASMLVAIAAILRTSVAELVGERREDPGGRDSSTGELLAAFQAISRAENRRTVLAVAQALRNAEAIASAA